MYRFVERYKKAWPIVLMCKVLKLSISAYYAWRIRPESVRKRENNTLITVVQSIHAKIRQSYGTRRMAREIRKLGIHIWTILALMNMKVFSKTCHKQYNPFQWLLIYRTST